MPVGGASAGGNVFGPYVMGTNDWHIVKEAVPTEGLGLVPWVTNPHFVPGAIYPGHMGETREERIAELHKWPGNTEPVIGFEEGAWVVVKGAKAELYGKPAHLFLHNQPNKTEIVCHPGASLDDVLRRFK